MEYGIADETSMSPLKCECLGSDVQAQPPSWVHAEYTEFTASAMNIKMLHEKRKWEAKSRASRQHNQAYLEQHTLRSSSFSSHCPQADAMYWFSLLLLLLAPPVTKRPFLLMTNKKQISPAPHPQNQPIDSGSVHESQWQQLWLPLHRSHRRT